MSMPVLYDYWRSSASYRVRIALNLLGIPYETVPVDLLEKEQKAPQHLARNPQGLVPVLEIDGLRLTQSLAIIEYQDETRPGSGLLPPDPAERARVRALAQVIAADIHPVCNLGPVGHVMALTKGGVSRGCRSSSARGWPRLRRFSTVPLQASSATAIDRPWPICAWCRSSTTPTAGMRT